jgi:hypothetical protein
MRGDDNQQEGMFSYVSPEKRVPADHPLRPIRKMVDEILKEMSPQFASCTRKRGAHRFSTKTGVGTRSQLVRIALERFREEIQPTAYDTTTGSTNTTINDLKFDRVALLLRLLRSSVKVR